MTPYRNKQIFCDIILVIFNHYATFFLIFQNDLRHFFILHLRYSNFIPSFAEEGDSKAAKTAYKEQTCNITPLSLVPPESLFTNATTEEKKELLEIYFSKLKEIVEIANQ